VKSIKDVHIQIMPPHDNHNHSLREMDTLLNEMSQLNAGHAPDRMPEELGITMPTWQGTKNFLSNTDKKQGWTTGDLAGKRLILQQVMCELALEVGGWPEPPLDKIRLSLQSINETKGHFPATKNYNLPTPIQTPVPTPA
jgi:hypothetical protein